MYKSCSLLISPHNTEQMSQTLQNLMAMQLKFEGILQKLLLFPWTRIEWFHCFTYSYKKPLSFNKSFWLMEILVAMYYSTTIFSSIFFSPCRYHAPEPKNQIILYNHSNFNDISVLQVPPYIQLHFITTWKTNYNTPRR